MIVRPDRGADHLAEYSTIAGNTIAYGATGGELFLRGRTGERFCVRNSGATGRLRGRGRPRLRVHDRRPRGRPRRDRAATSRPACPAASRTSSTSTADNVNAGNVGAVEALDDTDKQWLHDVVRRHQEETGSTVAEKLLADWDTAVARFSKIIPSTYKAVLAAKDAAELAGLSESETTEKMMEAATNG